MTKDIIKKRVLKYYELEKKSGFLLIGISAICMITIFLAKNSLSESFFEGLMYPLVILSIIEFVIGINIVVLNSKKEKEWENTASDDRGIFSCLPHFKSKI